MRRAPLTVLLFWWAAASRGEDCNQNGLDDATEIAEGRTADCDGNGVPDECDVRPRPIGFRVSERLPAVPAPWWLRTGDLDGDGDRDLVVASLFSGRSSLDLYLNDGRGRFGREMVSFANSVAALEIADFDGDGFADVAVGNNSPAGTVTLLWSAGLAEFDRPDEISVGEWPTSLAVADLDGDSDLDLAVALAVSGRLDEPGAVTILRNRGGRRFEEAGVYGTRFNGDLLAADLDSDGDADLVGTAFPSLNLLFNDGRGAFPEERLFSTESWKSLGMGDLDGDGDVDISGMTGGSLRGITLRLAWNDGSGAFREEPFPGLSGGLQDTGDLDRDGDADIAFVEDRMFPGLRIAIDDGRGALDVLSTNAQILVEPGAMDVTDLDGDGWPDIALTDLDTEEVLILIQNPVSPADCDEDGLPDTCTGSTADCDGDGVGDLCEIRLGSELDCNGNDVPDDCDLKSERSRDCNTNGIPDECDIVSGASLDAVENGIPDECESDCDRNGVLDFEEVGRSLVPDCNGNGLPDECDIFSNLSFSKPVEVPGLRFRRPQQSSSRRGPPVHADLDGDGDEDIVLPLSFALGISWRLGGGRFTEERLPLNFDPFGVAAADFDGDGDLDLVTANRMDAAGLPANASLLSNDGSGRFAAARNFALDGRPQGLVAADLDGDGDADVAVLDDSTIRVLANEGGRTFVPWDPIRMGEPSHSLLASDLDGDGRSELLTATASVVADGFVVWRLVGNGFEASPHDLPRSPRDTAVADLDGDGDPDVVVGLRDRVSIFRNRAGVLEFSISYPTGGGLLVVGDPDDDGDSDIVISWRSRPDRMLVLENLGPGSFVPRTIRLPRSFSSVTSIADIDEDGRDDLIFRRAQGNGLEISFSSRGTSIDCDGNLVPDECDEDCDENGIADGCDIAEDGDCNRNDVPDACDVVPRLSLVPAGELEVGKEPREVVLVDLDRDGRMDLFTASVGNPSILTVFRNAGAFRFEPLPPVPIQQGIRTYTLADLDGDGDKDIAIGSTQVRIIKNEGSRYSVFQVVEVGKPQREGVVALGSGDLDGDGDPDLAALMPSRFLSGAEENGPGAFLVIRNRGNGMFQPGDLLPIGCCVKAQAVLDGDSDGDLDVLVERGSSCADGCRGRWLLLRNWGDGSFEALSSDEATDEEFFLAAGVMIDPEEAIQALVSGFPDQTEADIDGDGLVDRVHSAPPFGDFFFGRPPPTVRFARGDGTHVERATPLAGCCSPLALGDLDGDGDPDLAAGKLLFRNDTLPAPSQDTNFDGVPDECDPRIPFHRGDPDGDGRATLADGTLILRSLFLGDEPSRCRESEDFTNDGRVDLTDPVALFRFLFLGGAPPAFPGPPGGPCGRDTDPPGSARDLGCEVYEGC